MICRHLVVTGRVQRVSYRDWLVGQAQALGVTGWVRNRSDGSVEAMVCGESEKVEALVGKAKRGSPASRVDGVAVSEAPTQAFDGFEERATA